MMAKLNYGCQKYGYAIPVFPVPNAIPMYGSAYVHTDNRGI